MTREEKIALLKDVTSGNRQAIEQLKKEKARERYFIPAFHYIIANGRTGALRGVKDFPPLKETDLSIMLEGLEVHRTEGIEQVSLRALQILAEVLQCFDFLSQKDELILLDPYLEKNN